MTRFDTSTGRFHVDPPIQTVEAAAAGDSPGDPGLAFELSSGEEAPIVAIRFLMGLRLDEPIGQILVRLGTTRATNALLERKGSKVGLVTTMGFGDVLKIGHQERPELFKLHIRKRQELTFFNLRSKAFAIVLILLFQRLQKRLAFSLTE